MAERIEFTIFHILKDLQNLSAELEDETRGERRVLMRNLVAGYFDQGLDNQEVIALSSFLFASMQYDLLIDLQSRQMELNKPVAWAYLGEAISYLEPDRSRITLSLIVDFASKSGDLSELTSTRVYDPFSSILGGLRISLRQQEQNGYLELRRTLLDQIRVLRQTNNASVESQLIAKFKRFFPNDPENNVQNLIFYEKKLQSLLGRRRTRQAQHRKFAQPGFTELEQTFLLQLEHTITEKFQAEPEMAMDLALIFIFIEDYVRAAKLLELMASSPSRDWWLAEVYILAGHFTSLLAYLEHLETTYEHLPDTYAAVTYLRAQAYWALGEKDGALSLMASLIRLYPQYRMAATLFEEWQRHSKVLTP